MRGPIVDMPKLPENSSLTEYPSVIISGIGPYHVFMDGLDCYIYKTADDGQSMNFLCKMADSSQTERLGIALLRGAAIQRDAEAARVK